MFGNRNSILNVVALASAVTLSNGYCLGIETTDANSIIVSRGTAFVTFADVDAYVERIPEKDRAGFMDSPARIENLLQGLLLRRQLANAAPGQIMEPRPHPTGAALLDQDESLSKETLAAFKKNIVVPDLTELAQETYALHKSEYVQQGRLDVQQVLVSFDKHSDSDALAIAKDVEAKAIANPAAFTDLVTQYSDEEEKDSNHGMIEGEANKKYAAELANTVTTLKSNGEISPVVKTTHGYHVLKLVKKNPDRQLAFADVRDRIVTQLRDKYIDQQMRDYINSFSNMTLNANPERVASLRDRYVKADSAPAAARTDGVQLESAH